SAADRSGSAQRERRSHRARPSTRLHRRPAHDEPVARNETTPGPVRHGHDVRRRRDGRGGNLRENRVGAAREPPLTRATLEHTGVHRASMSSQRINQPRRHKDTEILWVSVSLWLVLSVLVFFSVSINRTN